MLEPVICVKDQGMSAPAIAAFMFCGVGEIWSVLSQISAQHIHTHTLTTGLHENGMSCVNAVFSDPFGILAPELLLNLGSKDGLCKEE